MLRANDSDEEHAMFQQWRYSYPDERIMRRFEILWLHSCGKFAPEIATIVQLTTVANDGYRRFASCSDC